MAVNQAQVDHILSTASADDPEVKLSKLQDEVELIKTSIKRLLIDIRERMNDLDNPLSRMYRGKLKAKAGVEDIEGPMQEEATGDEYAETPEVKVAEVKPPAVPAAPPPGPPAAEPILASAKEDLSSDFAMLEALRSQMAKIKPEREVREEPLRPSKVRLQKVFRLFEWTTKNVKRYGHDRVDLMLESFRGMGYISDDACKLVKDIARLMTSTLGDLHDITAEEFVTELYELNHILNPQDATLDRDMIEVLMERRGEVPKRASVRGVQQGETGTEYLSPQERFPPERF
ncbi:MAG: hypothetical protein NT074_01005 [Methanomicrobiales archaeon]|nr:hypothetical protein [Methanomicrobiales archaeon]